MQPDGQPSSNPLNAEASGRSRRSTSIRGFPALARDAITNHAKAFSWVERFRRDLKSLGWGFTASLILHAVIMTFLALIVFQTRIPSDGDPLVATWANPEKTPEHAPRRRRTSTIPIEVAAISGARVDSVPPSPGVNVSAAAPLPVVPVTVANTLSGRDPTLRNAQVEQSGGSQDAERAIKLGLAWLSRHQTSDGHWELHQGYPDSGRSYVKTDTGATALSLLAFLGHGETHQSGEYQVVIERGLNWLQRVQDPSSGDLHDQRQEQGRNAAFYAHSMATIALCEAMAMTGDDRLRPSAELAIKYLIDSQHPDLGGWKYRPLNQRVMSGDISVTAWALMALHTARMAGIPVAAEEFQRSSGFLDRVQEQGGSRYKYEPDEPATRVTAARTAIGLLCRQWLGWPQTHPPLIEGVRFLKEDRHRPQWLAGRRNVFEWYYITQVMHNMGGDDWNEWSKAVRETIIQNQVTAGGTKPGMDIRGSWSPRPEGAGEEYADKAGRLYLTTMCLLILETPYRHRPIYAE